MKHTRTRTRTHTHTYTHTHTHIYIYIYIYIYVCVYACESSRDAMALVVGNWQDDPSSNQVCLNFPGR